MHMASDTQIRAYPLSVENDYVLKPSGRLKFKYCKELGSKSNQNFQESTLKRKYLKGAWITLSV